ncbi:MAG: SusC/RagA family TonB-linked outer membrane protein [Bacteroidetes bacterium]|nr:MAG: SusC/RagA family TonB-linked outer membrane protein [Bacteroidota bacterium]
MHTLFNAIRGRLPIYAIRGNILRRTGCFLFVSICLSLVLNAKSPSLTVSGKVTDSKKNPLVGVSVLLKGTKKGTTTNADGWFQMTDVPENGVLVFTYTGFEITEISVKGGGVIDITMTEIVSSLNEVVVTGYGTSKKKDLTGAIAQVKGPRYENENPRSVQDMLRGNAAGLDVGFDPSTKGQSGTLQIRGKGTLTASSQPLIVLDGVIYPGTLADINPNDIATIDILKDASSAAVFGARSANGVVLISTKKGKPGKPVITLNSNFGMNKLVNQPHLLNATEFLQFRADAMWAKASFDSTSKPGIQYLYTNPSKLPSNFTLAQWLALDGSTGLDPVDVWFQRDLFKPIEKDNYKAGKSLDWEDLIYNDNAIQHDHTISITQRREDFNYYFSLGYLTNEGLTVGDKYTTYRTRLNLEAKAAKFFTVGFNFQYSNRDESSVPVRFGDIASTTPWGSFYAADGVTVRQSPNDDPGSNTHPFLDQAYIKRLYKYDDFFASVYAKGDLPFGFSYQINFSPRYDVLREYQHQSSKKPDIVARKGVVNRRNQTVYSWQWDNILHWNKTFGKHAIEATFLVNAEKLQSWNTTIQAENFAPNDNLGYNGIQYATLPPIVNSDDQYETGDALMGRVVYNYNQRYLLTATVRRDGYSAFGQLNPRATFPSLAVAWTLTQEKFMKQFSKWLDYAKLRVSYGENGNRQIGRYAALSNLTGGTYEFITSGGARYNTSYLIATNLANPNLKWEANRSTNFGLDYSIFKGKVSGSFDFYNRITKYLLVNRTLSSVTGVAPPSSILTNLGEVGNKGVEFTVNTVNLQKRNFSWNTSFGIWTNKNKIIHLYGATPDYDPLTGKEIGRSEKDDLVNNWYIGKSISAVYDYPIQGVWQTADKALATQYGFQPGDMRLVDGNGDGKYTIADKRFIGDFSPKYSWNLRNEFKIYKNFDFSFVLYARMGQLSTFNEATNGSRNNSNNIFYDRVNFYEVPYWTPYNPTNEYGKIGSTRGGGITWNVYKKSSFVRLSNISLAYTIPAELTQKWKIGSLKFYANVVNAAVFSKWNYFDPEYHGADGLSNITPVPRTYNFGLNLTL